MEPDIVTALNQNIKPTFGGHEKFVFRHGWLKKGVDALKDNPQVFTQEEALATLGVGKNMVRSIRHWCLATGLAIETGNGTGRSLKPTKPAKKLIIGRGWDPYFEDIGSLWLLHWQLANNFVRGYISNLIFSSYIEPEFTKKQLQAFLERQIEQAGIKTTSGTIEREVDCCLRTYVTSTRSKPGIISEERLDCPLAELDIIRFVTEDNIYRFNIGPKVSLPVEVFGYALLQYLSSIVTSRRTVAIDECVYRSGSPGLVFKLDENSVVEYLELLEERTNGKVRVQENAGLGQVYLHHSIRGELPLYAFDLLKGHYEQK
jgi:hypothetical protein